MATLGLRAINDIKDGIKIERNGNYGDGLVGIDGDFKANGIDRNETVELTEVVIK